MGWWSDFWRTADGRGGFEMGEFMREEGDSWVGEGKKHAKNLRLLR